MTNLSELSQKLIKNNKFRKCGFPYYKLTTILLKLRKKDGNKTIREPK